MVLKMFGLKMAQVKAKILPRLSYMCHILSIEWGGGFGDYPASERGDAAGSCPSCTKSAGFRVWGITVEGRVQRKNGHIILRLFLFLFLRHLFQLKRQSICRTMHPYKAVVYGVRFGAWGLELRGLPPLRLARYLIAASI